jgi:hypothetical protein
MIFVYKKMHKKSYFWLWKHADQKEDESDLVRSRVQRKNVLQ